MMTPRKLLPIGALAALAGSGCLYQREVDRDEPTDLATRDALTGLPNRILVLERAGQRYDIVFTAFDMMARRAAAAAGVELA